MGNPENGSRCVGVSADVVGMAGFVVVAGLLDRVGRGAGAMVVGVARGVVVGACGTMLDL